MKLAWGKKVKDNPKFIEKLLIHCNTLMMDPSHLMACIAFETGETFSPSIRNAAGSGAVGLIQFMPRTAQALGTTTNELAEMTIEEQIDYVYKYFRSAKGKLRTLSDVYMTILWPIAVGKSESYVLFRKDDPTHPKLYIQNCGLDWNRDGVITKAEVSKKVYDKLSRGLSEKFVLSVSEI